MVRLVAVLAVVCVALTGCEAATKSSGPPPPQTREDRVRKHFTDTAHPIAAKERLASPPVIN